MYALNYPFTILIVDDEPQLTKLYKKILQKSFPVVHDLNNPLEALEFLKKETVHVVVLDIKMPEMDGFDLLKKIKEINNEIFTVVCTGCNLDIDEMDDLLKSGSSGFLFKPINRFDLINCVENVHKIYLQRLNMIHFSSDL